MAEISDERLKELEEIERKYNNKKSYYKKKSKEKKLSEIDTSTVGGKIKWHRKNNDITSKKLAERVGVSRGSMSNYENGTIKANIEIKLKIAESLQVAFCDIDPWTAKRIEEVDKKATKSDEING